MTPLRRQSCICNQARFNDELSVANPDSNYIDWLRETLELAQEAHVMKSNATGISNRLPSSDDRIV